MTTTSLQNVAALRVAGLTKSYDDGTQALDALSLTAPPRRGSCEQQAANAGEAARDHPLSRIRVGERVDSGVGGELAERASSADPTALARVPRAARSGFTRQIADCLGNWAVWAPGRPSFGKAFGGQSCHCQRRGLDGSAVLSAVRVMPGSAHLENPR